MPDPRLPDLLRSIQTATTGRRAFADHPRLLHPVDALAAHARRQFKVAGLPIPDSPDLKRAASAALEEMRPHLRAAIYTHAPARGLYVPGGGGKWKTSFERTSVPGEEHYARAVHDARVQWEKEAGLVRNGHRPASVVAVLHRPPGAPRHTVGYPHDALIHYGRHMTVLSHPARWHPGDTHNLHVFGRLHPMSADHAVVMAATEGVDEDPLGTGIPGGSEYPEGLILGGGLDFDKHAVQRRRIPDPAPGRRWWHPSGLTYGSWRVQKAVGSKRR